MGPLFRSSILACCPLLERDLEAQHDRICTQVLLSDKDLILAISI